MNHRSNQMSQGFSRRNFIKTSAALTFATMTSGMNQAFAAGSDKIRIGLIGCGGRGLYDSTNCLKSAPNIELVAMGDLFKDRLDSCLAQLKERLPENVKVTPETSFTGFDAYKKVIASFKEKNVITNSLACSKTCTKSVFAGFATLQSNNDCVFSS